MAYVDLNPALSAMTPVLRFAPSPNGELHLGHAYSALLNADLAQVWGGRFLLRIEDIDTTRCTPEFETAIYRDLAWLGISWEHPVRRQSDHFEQYRRALDRLIADDVVYPAFMSRGEIRAHIVEHEKSGKAWPRDPDGSPLYPGIDKRLTTQQRRERIQSGKPYAWRLDTGAVAKAVGDLTWQECELTGPGSASVRAEPERWGDVVVARSDIPTSYHLSVVVDDARQEITHVVRGKDLYEATSIHRVLQQLLGLPEPSYHHHRLVLDENGRKLSKSSKSTGLRAMRQSGLTPADIRSLLNPVAFGRSPAPIR